MWGTCFLCRRQLTSPRQAWQTAGCCLQAESCWETCWLWAGFPETVALAVAAAAAAVVVVGSGWEKEVGVAEMEKWINVENVKKTKTF